MNCEVCGSVMCERDFVRLCMHAYVGEGFQVFSGGTRRGREGAAFKCIWYIYMIIHINIEVNAYTHKPASKFLAKVEEGTFFLPYSM